MYGETINIHVSASPCRSHRDYMELVMVGTLPESARVPLPPFPLPWVCNTLPVTASANPTSRTPEEFDLALSGADYPGVYAVRYFIAPATDGEPDAVSEPFEVQPPQVKVSQCLLIASLASSCCRYDSTIRFNGHFVVIMGWLLFSFAMCVFALCDRTGLVRAVSR